jgi:hypothetical protein
MIWGKYMKNLTFASLILLLLACNSFADLMFIPLEEAVKDKDLIVVGTLTDITENSDVGETKGKGTIIVDQIIAGNVKTNQGLSLKHGDKLQLDYVENFACVMGSHKRIENEKGLFLLTLNESGEIETKDFRSLDSLGEVKKLLRKGIKTITATKVIKTISTSDEISQIPLETSDLPIMCAFGIENEENKYSPLLAFLAIFTSILLYYFLYRSRFKIR